jgi:hypothetical protein
MRVLHQSVFVLGLAALITVPALAQEKLGGRPPGDRGGILDDRGGIPVVAPRGIVGGLLMTKSVQEELKLTAEQVKDVSAAAHKVREKYQDDLTKLGTLEPKERAELLAKMDDEYRKAAAEILKPEQARRLQQIERQVPGVRAFLNEEVAKGLKLTDDQNGKIKGVITEYLKDLAALSKDPGVLFDKEKMEAHQKAVKKLTKAARDNIDEVLTADQRKAWKELTGAPFELKADAPPRAVPTFGGGNAHLFWNERVQKELTLTEEQVKSIQDGLQKVQEKYREEIATVTFGGGIPGAPAVPGTAPAPGVPGTAPGAGPDPEQIAELAKKVGAENNKVIAGVLKPEQAKRFKQIELQLLGIRALQNGEVVKALDLAADQGRRVKALCEDLESNTKFPERIMHDPAEIRKIMEAQKKLFMEAAPSLLTPDQRKKWEELTGAPFELEPARKP